MVTGANEPVGTTIQDDHALATERAAWFDARYDFVAHCDFGPPAKKIHLGTKQDRRCRYCLRCKPEATFRKLAHAFPELIGNRWLFDHWECDDCNEHFSKVVEDDFAKWTLPWRTAGRVSGKAGPLVYKSKDGEFRLTRSTSNGLKIESQVGGGHLTLDEERKAITLHLRRQTYVPMGVFKCLVKMALAVLQEEDTERCDHLRHWLLQETHSIEQVPYRPLYVHVQLLSGPLPSNRFKATLLRRKEGVPVDCPYLQFVLSMSNQVYQIAVPMPREDASLLRNGGMTHCWYPVIATSAIYQRTFGSLSYLNVDMSGASPLVDEGVDIAFKFERSVDVAPGGASSLTDTWDQGMHTTQPLGQGR